VLTALAGEACDEASAASGKRYADPTMATAAKAKITPRNIFDLDLIIILKS
jgi:hypothetical protein